MAKKTSDALSVPRRRSGGTARTPAAARSRKKPAPPVEPTFEQIAEAAYHRYLKRGDSGGTDFDDWLEAERELRSRRRTSDSQ